MLGWLLLRSRMARHREYCSLLTGLGSSSLFNQKLNQSTLPCCETIRPHGLTKRCVASCNMTSSTGLSNLDRSANHSHSPSALSAEEAMIRIGVSTLSALKLGDFSTHDLSPSPNGRPPL